MSERKPVGSVTILGGGIAGVQAALDIANADFKVYLIEEKPSIGGFMAQLDKTFPTNDCSSCMMGPKLVELANHPNIELLAYSELEGFSGEPGDFTVTVRKKARCVIPEKCVGCGICAAKCPTKVPDPFNLDLSERKAISVLFPQAVPFTYCIDKAHCRQFTKGKCGVCAKVCKNKAVDYNQKDEIVEIKTGAVILTGGFEAFDARLKAEYGYGRWKNVVTSVEYERILSAAGPFGGHIQRLDSGETPRRVAWIQCVGSRDQAMGRDYCSGVCCMYATKQAMITKEHEHDTDTTIFFIDMRAHGKGFDRFYERAKDDAGVRYVRSMVSRVVPNPENGMLSVTYAGKGATPETEEFDMVVLSVGLCAEPHSIAAAEKLGIGLNQWGFAQTDPNEMVRTTRPGIFVAGVFQAPKDIPDTVQQASSAAAMATALISESRGTLVVPPEEVPERDVTGEEPRIGVFVCHCGINIAGVVDVAAVAEYARSLPGVVYATNCMFACSTDQQKEIKRLIDEEKLNRVVVASCTPRTHEPLFRGTIREAGLNPYLFDLANIREQDSWVHQGDPARATEKAKDLVRMHVSRARLLEPLHEYSYPVTQSALVIGGGVAGLAAAQVTTELGFPAILVERAETLGGRAMTLHHSGDGANPATYAEALVAKVLANPRITVHTGTEVVAHTGSCGNFTTTLRKNGVETTVVHGAGIVAIGGSEYRPTEFLHGKHPRVITQRDFERMLSERPEEAKGYSRIAMIQCVGSREPEHPYCSRVCCTAACSNAALVKELNPAAEVSVLYRDIRTFSFNEGVYHEARGRGVRFYRFEADRKPEARPNGEGVSVHFHDAQIDRDFILDLDLLVLSSAIRPAEEAKHLAEVLRLPLDQDGFFLEAHLKLRPLDFATAGFFLCGLAQGPKFSAENIAQGYAAAARAAVVLAKETMVSGGVAASFNKTACVGCQACVACCPFGAISYNAAEGKCDVNRALCMGCGTCAATCPSEAITLLGFSHTHIYAEIDEALAASS